MSWLPTVSVIISAVLMSAGGLVIAGVCFYYAALFSAKYAAHAWSNLAAIYKLAAMEYWFNRMQENGTHLLRKEHDEKLAQKQFNEGRAKLVREAGAAPAHPGEQKEGDK